MPEVKLNSKNPFYLKFSDPELTAVQISVYVYSGTKDADKGQPKFQLYKDKVYGTNDVIFEISDLVKDYLTPSINTPLNDNVDYVKWVQIESQILSDKPTANDLTIITERNSPKDITLSGFDVKFRPLTYAKETNPSFGGVVLDGRTATYTPNTDYEGTDQFTYTVNNGIKDSDPATVTIKVQTADNGWNSTQGIRWGTSLSDARQNLIDDTNALNIAPNNVIPTDKIWYHLGYSVTAPYNVHETGLIDIGREHWQEVNRVNPAPDGYYALYYWSDQPTNPDHQQIATFQISNGVVSKAFVYNN